MTFFLAVNKRFPPISHQKSCSNIANGTKHFPLPILIELLKDLKTYRSGLCWNLSLKVNLNSTVICTLIFCKWLQRVGNNELKNIRKGTNLLSIAKLHKQIEKARASIITSFYRHEDKIFKEPLSNERYRFELVWTQQTPKLQYIQISIVKIVSRMQFSTKEPLLTAGWISCLMRLDFHSPQQSPSR